MKVIMLLLAAIAMLCAGVATATNMQALAANIEQALMNAQQDTLSTNMSILKKEKKEKKDKKCEEDSSSSSDEVTVDPFAFPQPLPPTVVNYDLQYAQVKYKAEGLEGPESIAVDPAAGWVYTGTQDGKIVRMRIDAADSTAAPEVVAILGRPEDNNTGEKCGTWKSAPICGRPLGLKIHPEINTLFFVDAYYGIAQLNTVTLEVTKLVDADYTVAGGVVPELNGRTYTAAEAFFNDVLYIAGDGLYFSTTSDKFRLNELLWDLLDLGANGAVFKYDFVTRQILSVAKGFGFANGILLHPDGKRILVAETTRFRISEIDITPANYGKVSMFAHNLSVLPDNLAIIGDELWTSGNVRVGSIANDADPAELPVALDFSIVDVLALHAPLRPMFNMLIPKHMGSVITAGNPGALIRISLKTQKQIEMFIQPKSSPLLALSGLGKSLASLKVVQDAALPKDQVYVLIGSYVPEAKAIGRFVWDLKNKVIVPQQ